MSCTELLSASRREFLSRVLFIAACFPAARAEASQLPHLDQATPTAEALAYTPDASTIDQKKEPLYMPGRICSKCQLFQTAQESGGYAPCLIFPGTSVNAKGWCRTWTAKTTT